MKIFLTILVVLVLVVVVTAAGVLLFYHYASQGPLPQIRGSIEVPGLNAQVEVLRDSYGIPHIYASNPYDLFFAQGYVQAQDRWWQMEFNRHIGRGAIQELTGRNEAAMGTDIFIRTVGWREAAERTFASGDEEELSVLQAFADGVNAYIGSRPQELLALEYRLLGLTGITIELEPWTPVDTLNWGIVMSWNLTDSYDYELTLQAIIDALGPDMAYDYAPPFPFETKPTIVQLEDLPLTEESIGTPTTALPTGRGVSRMMAGGYHAAASPLIGGGIGIGSNNWVVGPAMTEGGLPLLANDPHLGIGMPSIWYEIGLHCLPKTEDCPYDVVGFTFPASPAVIIGRNADIAWGVTNAGADVQDLYRITVNPENALQYLWDGAWRDMTVREQTIRFGDGSEPLTFQVRETHLGPIINDNQRDPETGALLGFNNDDPLALRWTALEPLTLFRAVVRLNRARDWEEFRDALQYWDVPAQNFVYADVRGNIGYQLPGRFPIRAADHDSALPVDGTTSAYEWRGYIPFDLLPRIYNPERGYIVTANQAIVPEAFYEQLAEALGEDANYQLGYHWSYGYRGERINDMLRGQTGLTREDMGTLQADTFDINASEVAAYLSDLEIEDAALRAVRDWLIEDWDFRFDASSPQAAFYAYFSRRLLDNLFNDQLPEDIRVSSQQLWPAVRLMADPENRWWDDARTPDIAETRDEILLRSLSEAYEEASSELGTDREAWRWGALHTATFVSNPLGLSGIGLIEELVNRGPVETGGGNEIVNATGWSVNSGDFTVRSLPSMRLIVNFSQEDGGLAMHTTGQSGHPFSPHYDDLISLWAAVDYHPLLFTRAAVEQAAVNRLVLNPAGE
ncbi:MAG: penicillin acylase family protein [Aggregatilineales bacterium]